MRDLIAALAAAGSVALGAPASAAVLELELSGALRAGDALNPAGEAAAAFGAPTPFVFRARFDPEGTRYGAGPPGAFLPGYAAYAFDEAGLTIGGTTYAVASYADDPVGGVVVALFDPSNLFNPGYYAVGFFGEPGGVGPGLNSRYATASPSFLAADPTPATWGGYLGYGAVSGPNTEGGTGEPCQQGRPQDCAAAPIALTAPDGSAFELSLLSGAYDGDGASAFTAELAPIPLPGSAALLLTALLGGAALRARASRREAG